MASAMRPAPTKPTRLGPGCPAAAAMLLRGAAAASRPDSCLANGLRRFAPTLVIGYRDRTLRPLLAGYRPSFYSWLAVGPAPSVHWSECLRPGSDGRGSPEGLDTRRGEAGNSVERRPGSRC